MLAEPVAGAVLARLRQVHARRRQAAQGQPAAVDVVAPPAAVPGAVLLLASSRGSGPRAATPDCPIEAEPRRVPRAPRPVMSSQLGSIIALWSAKGMKVSISASQPRSKAPQPPSRFCIASSQLTARASHRRLAQLVLRAGRSKRAWRARAAPRRCRRSRGRARWRTRSTSRRPAARGGRRQASAGRCASRPSSQRAASSSRGSSSGIPDRASVCTASAVSQTGDRHGCTRRGRPPR